MSNSFATPWTVAHQPPLSMGFSRQEYWSGLPFPSPGDLPNPGTNPVYPASLKNGKGWVSQNLTPHEGAGLFCCHLGDAGNYISGVSFPVWVPLGHTGGSVVKNPPVLQETQV